MNRANRNEKMQKKRGRQNKTKKRTIKGLKMKMLVILQFKLRIF